MKSHTRLGNIHTKLCLLAIFLSNVSANDSESGDTSGTWLNVSLGFGLVIFGATLSTLGSMILFLDAPLRLLPWFPSDFSLATSKTFLASSLSFSTGVLTTTIFINLIPEGINAFKCSNIFGDHSTLAAAIYFSVCTLAVLSGKNFSIKYKLWKENRNKSALKREDLRIPFPEILSRSSLQEFPTCEPETGHSPEALSVNSNQQETREKFKKLGYQVAIAIALHNFPEGVVLFVSAYQSINTGILFGLALALHKFPEGIMIGIPIFFGSNSKWKAAGITAASSFITQLLGATFAYLLFKVYWNTVIAGILFLFAASILINTVFSGMLPLARQYDPEDKYCTTWLCIGVAAFVLLTSIVHEDSSC